MMTPPSYQSNLEPTKRRLLFLISLPLLGLWVFFIVTAFNRKFLKREDVRRLFVLHALLLSYIIVSHIFLSLSLWLVPYFMEPALWVFIRINIAGTVIAFELVTIWAVWGRIGNWSGFDSYRVLVSFRDWFFLPPPSLR